MSAQPGQPHPHSGTAASTASPVTHTADQPTAARHAAGQPVASHRVDSSAAAQHALQTQLQMETGASERLLACLAEERSMMEQHDSDGLLRCVENKTLALRQLENLIAQRSAVFATLPTFFQNLPPQLIAQNLELKKTHELYTRLHGLAKDISHQNEINAAINSRGRQAVQRLLHLVRGNEGASALYNQLGQTASRHYGQSISQA